MRAIVLLLLLPVLTGCASFVRGTVRSYDVTPQGLTRADDLFRRSLVTGGYGAAFRRTGTPKEGAPEDALLRAMYRGLTGFYAGEYDATASAFAEADRLAEQRITRSVSRGALSLVTNDRVLPYLPSRTERLFVRYYAMLARTQHGDLEGAAVEARRLGRLLEETSGSLDAAERALHATMRDAAGAVFEAAGEENDALVSYRNAALLRGESRGTADSIALQPVPSDSATLVVLVESGFVAHRVDEGLTIGLAASDSAGAIADDESMAERIAMALEALPDGGIYANGRRHRSIALGDEVASFVRVAWPALRRSWSAPAVLQLAPDSARSVPVGRMADVSDAVAADLRRDRAWQLARLVVRTTAKAAAAEALREKHGQWAGMLASMAGSALERADTRSWQLLPGALTAVRITVPAGAIAPVVRVGDEVEATIRLPALVLRAGERRVTSVRVWRDPASLGVPAVAQP